MDHARPPAFDFRIEITMIIRSTTIETTTPTTHPLTFFFSDEDDTDDDEDGKTQMPSAVRLPVLVWWGPQSVHGVHSVFAYV
jgi:hypothetical protein